MKVLIACEYSRIVASAFERKGHDVTSCDLLPAELPGKHYQGNVMDIIDDGFDLMVAHPPCTYLCKAQIHRLSEPGRQEKSDLALNFVKALLFSRIPKVAIENPLGRINTAFKPHDQLIYPYMFGDAYRKDIALWLKNLPPIPIPSETLWNPLRKSVSNHVNSRMSQEQKSKIKSRFFYHTAEAMANAWG